jgi:rhodanese-related sulfurtransferase
MNKRSLFMLSACLVFGLSAKAQLHQRFDNSDYKAIYFKEACALIANTPGLLVLDVRSPGEYADSSPSIGNRIGRLKGAVNISIDSIDAHVKYLEKYMDKPILVYCSHSQRSRMVSKGLADYGFKQVYSLNGGITLVDKSSDAEFPCKESLYTSNLPYKLMAPGDAFNFVKDKTNLVIDVRPAAQFNGSDTTEANNIGRIKDAINIPLSSLDKQLPVLAEHKEKPILVYDLNADSAESAADKLAKAGFKNVSVLFQGFNTLLTCINSASPLRQELTYGTPAYKIIGVQETVSLVKNEPGLVVADMRPKLEFDNMSSNDFSNLGHIVKAKNLSVADLKALLKTKPKSTPVLVYGAYGPVVDGQRGTKAVDLGAVCKQLVSEGYKNVYLLYNGIYSVVWSSGNDENCVSAKAILTDHEHLY